MHPPYTDMKLGTSALSDAPRPSQVCKTQFSATQHVPLETAAGAPKATVDPAMYIPPALRYGSAGELISKS